MRSYANLTNFYTSLTQNTSASNQQFGQGLMNDQHRFLIEKYFDNLRTSVTTTIGGDDYTTTAVITAGATSATLSSAWTLPTCQQLTNFDNDENDQRLVLFTNGSTAISWAVGLSSTTDSTTISTVGVQAYLLPANISKIKDDTISVGQLKFTPTQILTQQDWDRINFLPYTSDIPNYYYIYNGYLNIFPIPSTTGNIITFNYKTRVPDFSFIYGDASGGPWTAGGTAFDYQKGTIAAATVGSTAITGTSTAWNSTGNFPLNVDVTSFNLYLTINPAKGDGIQYQIYKFTSDTALVLTTPIINAPSISSATYAIGQMPLLSEDFHDMLAYGGAMTYFGSTKKDEAQYKLFKDLYGSRLDLLKDYAGTRSVSVDLGEAPNPQNPNLYIFAP